MFLNTVRTLGLALTLYGVTNGLAPAAAQGTPPRQMPPLRSTIVTTASGCQLLIPLTVAVGQITWSGACPDGRAEGEGTVISLAPDVNYSLATTYHLGSQVAESTVLMNGAPLFRARFTDAGAEGPVVWTEKGVATTFEYRAGDATAVLALSLPDGTAIQGRFDLDGVTGHGVIHKSNGERYEGDFVHGRYEGHGTYYYETGIVFDGQWHDGQRHGGGKLTSPTGTYAIGTWENGRMAGRIVSYAADGTVIADSEIREGKRQGQGFKLFEDGARYQGT